MKIIHIDAYKKIFDILFYIKKTIKNEYMYKKYEKKYLIWIEV